MLKGRRTRNAEKISAKPVHDDTASPKRKDIKYASKDNNDNVKTAQQISPITAKLHVVEPMKLRGGRAKTSDISQYLEKKASNPKIKDVITCIPLPQTEDQIIDITNENADNSFEVQLLDSPASEIRDEVIDTKQSINNNIFLQEPVLSLNFAKVSNAQNHTFTMMHNSFLTSSEIKSDPFSSSLQPKINSFWKVNCLKSTEEHKKTSITNVEQHVLDLSKPTQVTQIDSTTTAEILLHDGENSCDSGDSGVVILSGSDGSVITKSHSNNQSESTMNSDQTENSEKRKKPATPHRILCPSPAKTAIIYLQSPPGLLNVASSDNSRIKRRTGINKTRKRLIVKDDANTNGLPTEVKAELKPQKQNDSESEMITAIEPGEKKLVQNRKLIIEPTNAKQTTGGSKKITEFYPIRRSVRKTKKEVQVERDRDIEQAIREGREEGLKIEHFEGKGRGIVTTRPFFKGEFVVEYIGDLISVSEAKQREQIYAKDDNTGCYIIDATAESGRFGRLVNHSRNGNLVTKTVPINNRPHLVLIAKEDIEKGAEVTYDYGDRSKEALQHYPWLAL
uniref:[histone H4]-lysine(20) N-methyltransferase n=1 Tax=Anopheles funestus TaxID=62324 RepID=A0A182RS90_ANOFN